VTSPARFLAAALAVYVLAISGGIVLFFVFRDSLEDLSQKLRWRLAERRRRAASRRVPPLRLRLLLWEPIAARVGVERRLRRRLSLRARPTATAAARTPGRNRLAWAVIVPFFVFRDSLEDLSQKLRWRLAERRRRAPSRRVPRLRLRLLLWEPIAARVGVERRLRRRLSRARPTTTAAARTPGHNRLAWAVAAVVAVVAATAVVATHDFGSGSRTGARASAELQAVPWKLDQLLRPPPVSSTGTAVGHARTSSPNHATSQSARSAPPTQQTPVQHTPVVHTPVVSNLQPVSEHTPPAAGKTSAATTSHGGGLTPLRAPKAAPPPTPLKAP
jgi:hypothetical protein